MIEKTINNPTTVWVADDGTTFNSKEECMAYEKSQKNPIETKANMVPHFITGKDWLDSGAFDSELYVIFYPRNLEDVQTIKEWENLRCYCSSMSQPESPQPMIYDCYDYADSGVADDLSKIVDVGSYLGTYSEFKNDFVKSIDSMFACGEDEAVVVKDEEV